METAFSHQPLIDGARTALEGEKSRYVLCSKCCLSIMLFLLIFITMT